MAAVAEELCRDKPTTKQARQTITIDKTLFSDLGVSAFMPWLREGFRRFRTMSRSLHPFNCLEVITGYLLLSQKDMALSTLEFRILPFLFDLKIEYAIDVRFDVAS